MKFVSIELAEDVKNLVKFNSDVKVEEHIKRKIFSFQDDDILVVTKEVTPLKIIDVELVDEKLLSSALGKSKGEKG